MLKLDQNGTIGFFSPSTPITFFCPKRFQRAHSFIESKGFSLKAGNLTGKRDGYRSGNTRDRAEELNDLIRDPQVRCILSTIGGLNSNSLLPYIDYDAFQKDPKILMGFSDVTAILMAVYARTGIPTYYGPALVASFGELPPYTEMTWQYFEEVCINPALPYTLRKPDIWTEEDIDWESQTESKPPVENQWVTLNEGVAEGRLIIGNLNTITCIWGSPYMPMIKDGDILFIEDTQKSAAMMERLFAFLKINGVFDKISGLILGKHERFNDQKTGKSVIMILEEVVGQYTFPVLAQVDCSHTHPMLTIPLGSRVRLDASAQTLTLLEY
ncbi:MAG: LD-carboxypeptidase [Desulfobacteraceae bacterium]|nr:MAG: LD-carboxypeptidase [Desulfobacteraceae bacterium]